ncbi:MAG: TolC family protein [Rikenellaceae bacterium]
MKRGILALSLLVSGVVSAQGYDGRLTLTEAIDYAHQNSASAKIAELNFMSKYWDFRSFKAELLPALNLSGDFGNFDRSVVEARDYVTGEINYVSNNTLSNDVTLSIDQQIALTGGTISLTSSLSRLDQFSYDATTFQSNPVTIQYTQPIRGFNTLKWQKRSEPLEYESAKRSYLESMQTITINTTSYFFAVLTAQTSLRNNIQNSDDTRELYEIAKQRFEIGSITKSELLQLELSQLNAEISTNDSRIALETALFNLKFYLGIIDDRLLDLVPPTSIPQVDLTYDFVLERALENSTHDLSITIDRLSGEQSVAQAKANRGVQLSFRSNLGLSQTANTLPAAYRRVQDQEVVGLSVSMPIFDWGMSRGKVKLAEAELQLIETEIEQSEISYRQDIMIKVMEFNNLTRQCEASLRAVYVAGERYQIMKDRFTNGGVTVTDLNTAQEEMDDANDEYVSQLKSFWSAYYDLQKTSLYDFILKRDINAEFDRIIENQL